MMRWLIIVCSIQHSANEETYAQIIFYKNVFCMVIKKTHTKVNETTHFTTKVMLDFMKTISQFHYEWCGNVKQMSIY